MTKTKKRVWAKILLLPFLTAQFYALPLVSPKKIGSANLTSVSDTLSTSRLSFVGALDSSNTEGSSLINIKTSSLPGWASSDRNYNIFPGETVLVGGTNNYVVDDVLDPDPEVSGANDNQIQLTGGLNAGDADEDDPIIATVSATHTIDMTTATAIANGAIRIKVKATGDDDAAKDGIPDPDGFDFSTGSWDSSDITCPDDIGSTMDFVDGTATASGDTGCDSGYHCFECRYSGSGNASQDLTDFVIGSTRKLINPAPATSSHTYGEFDSGTADAYSVVVEHLDSSDTVVDSTTIKVGLTEAVRVTATVDPSISFTVTGVTADSGDYCGVTRTASSPDTTATTVPFGSLSLSSFNDAVHQLSCVTNAASGYSVTVIEDDQLSIGGDGSTEIADTNCDATGSCNESDTADEWSTDTTESGFGFSMQNDDASKVALEHDTNDCSTAGYTGGVDCSACDGGASDFCAMRFPANADAESALTIMQNLSTPSGTEDAYMCYRTAISTVQPAGDYENFLTYVATATF